MAESEPRRERVPSPETGRHSHRRRAKSRRAGDRSGALSDGKLESYAARWITGIVGAIFLISLLIVTPILMPGELARVVLVAAAVAAVSLVVVVFDRLRSKKRNPRPRWVRGILIAGFLCVSVAVGSLAVLEMTAGPSEEWIYSPGDSGPERQADYDEKTMQLKLLIFYIFVAAAGLAMLAFAFVPERTHRSESGRSRALPSLPPA